MNQSFQFLEWDSDFFKLNVWKLNKSILTIQELNEELKQSEILNADLIYYSSENELKYPGDISNLYEIKFVDKKTTYSKKVTNHYTPNKSISSYNESYPENKLIDLAIQSGLYSRFNADSKILKSSFEELYTLWIVNSVNKQIAKEVLIYREENEIKGFVTLGEKNKKGEIGIIAVDSNYRGHGIGKALMNSAEHWFSQNGFSEIQAATQAENTPACRLYESCNYTVSAVEYYYHIWKR